MKKIFILLLISLISLDLSAKEIFQLTEKQVDDFCGVFRCYYNDNEFTICIELYSRSPDGKYNCSMEGYVNNKVGGYNGLENIKVIIDKNNKIELQSNEFKAKGKLKNGYLILKIEYKNEQFAANLKKSIANRILNYKFPEDIVLINDSRAFKPFNKFVSIECFKHLLDTSIPESNSDSITTNLSNQEEYSNADYRKLENNLRKEAKNSGLEVKQEDFQRQKALDILKLGRAVALTGRFSDNLRKDLILRTKKRMAEKDSKSANKFLEKNPIRLKTRDYETNDGDMMLIFGYNEKSGDFLIHDEHILWLKPNEIDELAKDTKKLKMIYLAPVGK